ncbi:MAG: M23 family metallopeptidase [Candidatus Promineofilum sp.]|nr:M23 family metallopeptidase [Promineifilum sp.]
MKRLRPWFLLVAFVAFSILAIRLFIRLTDGRAQDFVQWGYGDEGERAELITVQRDACPGAPFILPTDGFIGLLYEDPNGPYSSFAPHQGIDIFSNASPGVSPVYAAYDGYIYRESGWRSALIQRIPDDPLVPGRQIWLYYAHMADREGNSFIVPALPPGTAETYVQRGTLLGYTGDYNGNSLRDIWVHLHFSIVLDDGEGRYLNELEFANTLDPTPYLGMPLNHACREQSMGCSPAPDCRQN